MDPHAASHVADGSSPPTLTQSISELWGSVRSLVADEADLLAAEARVATRTLVAAIGFAVGAAVFAVLGVAALMGMIAARVVESGYSWVAALSLVFLLCAAGCGALVLALRGLTSRRLFAASRRELRGKS
jgi:uncharacterized membrane protein YqjE